MRSVSVVLPESMWAEMPMLRMRSRGMRVAKGVLYFFSADAEASWFTKPGVISTRPPFVGRRSDEFFVGLRKAPRARGVRGQSRMHHCSVCFAAMSGIEQHGLRNARVRDRATV